MQKADDLGRSSTVLEQNSTLIAVIEMSLSSWFVAGIVPGVESSSVEEAWRRRRRAAPVATPLARGGGKLWARDHTHSGRL